MPNSGDDIAIPIVYLQVSDIVHACGPRVRSLWRFVRAGRRPAGAAKPADVNSLLCEDEDECYLSVEYRVSITLNSDIVQISFQNNIERLEHNATFSVSHNATRCTKLPNLSLQAFIYLLRHP